MIVDVLSGLAGVAPRRGAWIETTSTAWKSGTVERRAPPGRVD